MSRVLGTLGTCAILVPFIAASAAGCSGGSSGYLRDGGATDDGAVTPQTQNVDEKEPNNGPDLAGAQDLGTLANSTTLVIKGELSSGGNDGTKYTGDFDLFAFDIPNGGSLEVTVDWTSAADVDFAVYDAQIKQVFFDGTTAQPAKGSGQNLKGKYVLGLYSKDAATPYTATIKYTKSTTATPDGGGKCSPTPIAAAQPSGGCTMSLVTPACSVADLTGGKTFELAWSTSQTFCEGPHKIQIGGDPPSSWAQGNAVEYQLSSTASDPSWGLMTRNSGGYIRISAKEIATLTSPSGIYYYRVTSWFGSASEVIAFQVVK